MVNPITDTGIWRDIIMRVDGSMRPIDSYQSLWKGGVNRGSAFYWTHGDELSVVSKAPNGVLTQTIEVPGNFSIATRPQAAFAWHLWYYDFDRRGTQKASIYVVDREGLSVGSILGELVQMDVELLGEEQIMVEAGRFDTWRFRVGTEYELWADKKDLLTVRLVVAKKNRIYELTELIETVPR